MNKTTFTLYSKKGNNYNKQSIANLLKKRLKLKSTEALEQFIRFMNKENVAVYRNGIQLTALSKDEIEHEFIIEIKTKLL